MGLWETAKQFVEGAKTRTKVLSALDKGRLTALVPNFRSKDPLSDFMTRWITKTFEDISAATSGAGLDGFQHEKASEVFHALVAAGGVPHSLIQEWGQPPEVWPVIEQALESVFSSTIKTETMYGEIEALTAEIAKLEPGTNNIGKTISKAFTKAGNKFENDRRKWQVIVKEYVTDLYSYLFTSYSERNWMTMVDFTPSIGAAVKDCLPAAIITRAPAAELLQVVEDACSSAYEEQRGLPAMWEVTKTTLEGPATRKKVCAALEEGRRVALRNITDIDEFMRTFIRETVKQISIATKRMGLVNFTPDKAVELFHLLVSEGTIPPVLVEVSGVPAPNWYLIGDQIT